MVVNGIWLSVHEQGFALLGHPRMWGSLRFLGKGNWLFWLVSLKQLEIHIRKLENQELVLH